MSQSVFDAPPQDPIALFSAWLAEARAHEPNDPDAMSVATYDNDGLPNVRMLLLKGCDARGFTFYTNMESRKAAELAAHPSAALCFHWKSLRRQIRIRGSIEGVADAEADAYFSTRSRPSQLGAWASQQSHPLAAYSDLQAAFARYEREFAARDIPRPPHWRGQRVVPVSIEFWQSGDHRLHHRLVYHRPDVNSAWQTQLLYP